MSTFTRNLTFVGSAVALTLTTSLPLCAENKIPDECKVGGFAIGCIVYTVSLR